MHNFKKGDAVIIKSQELGGEVIETERPDGMLIVKVAKMNLTSRGLETLICSAIVHPSDLQRIDKKHGVVYV